VKKKGGVIMFKWLRKKFQSTLIRFFGIDKQYGNGKTLLMYAAEDNDMAQVENLVKKGANLNMQDKKGMTALIYASKNSNYDMANALVQKGANVEIEDVEGKKAMNYALLGNNTQLADLLEGRSKDFVDKKLNEVSEIGMENKEWAKELEEKFPVDNTLKTGSIIEENWKPEDKPIEFDNNSNVGDAVQNFSTIDSKKMDPWENKQKDKKEPIVINEKWNVDNRIKETTTAERKEIDRVSTLERC